MITRIRNSQITKVVALLLLMGFLSELFQPMRLYALSGGPSQPEMAGFTPADTDNMVDMFSGNFHYTIPIMTVPGPNGGYPINLNYNSEVGMEHEASWVGLGWNLNPGAINRQVRGIPDDFKGDEISKTYKRRDNNTFIFTPAYGGEVFGADFGLGISQSNSFIYNTYNGISMSRRFGLSASYVRTNEIEGKKQKTKILSMGASLTFDSDNGITHSFSMNGGSKNLSLGLNYGYNSKSGTYTYGSQIKISSGQQGGSGLSGFSIGNSFSTAANLPPIHIPLSSNTFGMSFQMGGSGAYLEGYASMAASVCLQTTPDYPVNTSAYGLCYADKATIKSLQDFNREKELCVDKDSKNLPLPVMTPDVYNIAGEAINGSFRVYRSDYGHFFDNQVENTTTTTDIGADVAIGTGLQVGVNLAFSSGNSYSGDWATDDYDTRLSYKDKQQYAAASTQGIKPMLYEPFYFKMSGEQTANERNYLQDIGNIKPVNFTLQQNYSSSFWGGSDYNYSISNQLNTNTINRFEQTNRMKRTTLIEYQTGSTLPSRKNHHISSFSLVNTSGERYTYGKTLYNVKEKEVMFSAPYYAGEVNTTTLQYNIDYYAGQASGVNRVGKEKLYSCTETPAYAYSYLLTEITAPDYVDVNNNHTPDDADLGYWVKFTYDTKYQGNNLYRWRFPYEGANFFMGDRSNQADDKGSYNYGEKEIAYVKKIETKTHKAVFYISERNDALGIKSVDSQGNPGEYGGGKNTNAPLYKLDSIALFSKDDTLVPVKTAIFVYDYSLCESIPNSTNNSGKLTLKSLYFKYENSEKGEENPYVFHYGYDNPLYNPDYNSARMDRWGNYKENANYFEHYVSQNKEQADRWAQAWLLTKIELPSGGAAHMEYESDDYAYVQDKQAMCMVKMIGPTDFNKENGNYYIYFQKSAGINAKEYVKGFKNNLMFFKTAIRYESGINPDYIQGYVEIYPETAIDADGSGTTGKVKVKPFAAYDTHPIYLLALQYLKNNRPDLLFDNADADEDQSDVEAFFRALVSRGIIKKVSTMFGGNGSFYRDCISDKDYAFPVYNLTGMPSYVRLNVPSKIKYGGGVRVKAITMQDNWEKSENSAYRQEYYYRKMENGKIISSGVAEYEPTVCAEETALRYPIYDKVKGIFFIEDEMYSEEPYGENYFPAANVGYSQVIVRTFTPSDVQRSTTGIQRYEYYTAKDYPIRVEQTNIVAKITAVPNILEVLTAGFKQANSSAYSQGYLIELNNMHGRQKSIATCPYIPLQDVNQWIAAVENSGYTSKIAYFYKTKNGNRIDNEVDVLKGDGVTEKKILGQMYDFVIDQRENNSTCIGGGENMQFMLATWTPPLFGGSGFPSFDSFQEQVRSVATTKVIYNTGILETVKNYNKGSVTTTKYLQFDPYTGKPLLTSVTNEFEEPIYTYNMPAYWYYENMGSAAENYRAMFFSNTQYNLPNTFNTYDRIENDNALLPIKSITNNNATCWNFNGTESVIPLSNKEIMRSRFSNQSDVMNATVISLVNLANPDNRTIPMLEAFNQSDTNCFVYLDCKGIEQRARIEYVSSKLYFFKDNAYYGRFCIMPFSDLLNVPHISFSNLNLSSGTIKNYFFIKRGNVVDIKLRASGETVNSFTWNDKNKIFEECIDGVLQASAIEYKNQFGLEYADAGITMNDNRSNYLGIPNICRSLRSNLYVTERNQTGRHKSYQTNIAYDGTFTTFQLFNDSLGNDQNQQNPWTWNAEITKYNPYNFEIENKNALNIYSSALYGYKNALVTAVAQNSRYYEMGYDSFEDDPQKPIGTQRGHIICTSGSRTDAFAHTGNYALQTANNQLVIHVKVQNSASQFSQDGTLNLIKDSLYVFSCWVRKSDCATMENNGNVYLFSATGDASSMATNKEQKIDCWQRIEVLFAPKQTGDNIFLTLQTPIAQFYVDDIRIMPAKAVLKSYVYDNKYRLIAELDENNYAAFYNYDEEGVLIQIKKETERGIQTLQTTRQNFKKRMP
jgi:hypothetical protein